MAGPTGRHHSHRHRSEGGGDDRTHRNQRLRTYRPELPALRHGTRGGKQPHPSYRAPERFQDIARALGLPASTATEGVASYAAAVERLRDAVGIEPSFRALGIDEAVFIGALPRQALNAYEDQCAPANPRMPMLDDMKDIMRTAYYAGPRPLPSV
ncbi:hypothetical protein GCM10010271_07250 [Streptomyces kurssanovii]|nr:hypothetical protein GCM10010271_07250 [Streptomyces kurssanovii]